LVPTLIVPLVVSIVLARRSGRHRLRERLVMGLNTLVTLAVAASAGFLIWELVVGRTAAPELLRDAALIWVANVLIFALWYWEIDGGGPRERYQGAYHSADFAFPQVALGRDEDRDWHPEFVDYLFVAFNTSTAFSPTDTLILSRRAKWLTMAQALIALVVVVVIAARAINTLPGG
jgi:hypothetical protein